MIEEIKELLVGKDSEDDLARYARLTAMFGLATVANSIRVGVMIPRDNKSIPVNMYGVMLGGSGIGKTRANGFVNDLIDDAMEIIKEKATDRLEVMDPFKLEEISDLTSEGVTVATSYKSLTDSAVLKLMKVLDNTGYFSINYVMDEFASVVTKEYEMLSSTVIEIYDKGVVPTNLRATSKIPKAENPIPMNMLAFGSSHLLFESDTNTEKSFMDLLQAGMARRSVFVDVQTQINTFSLDANSKRVEIDSLKQKFVDMVSRYENYIFKLSNEAESAYTRYMDENTSDSIGYDKYQVLNKIYAKNKYWIALKLSGLIAISNFHNEITLSDYEDAISIVNNSELDFQSIINRKPKYELVVDFLLDKGTEESEYTLTQQLPFYKEVKSKRQFLELMRGYSYDNNITFMTTERHNVVFYSAKGREKVDLDKPLAFSYSVDITKDYFTNDDIVWKDFHKVVCNPKGICYSAHSFKDGYRKADNAIEGFSLIILDFDEGSTIDMAKVIFQDYTYLISTTKSHLKEKNGKVEERFRVILPMSNKLELDKEQYSQFYRNILEDLPIQADNATKDISRFYYSAGGEYWYNDGEMIDATKYIPNTQEFEIYEKEGIRLAKKQIDGIGQYILRNQHNGRNNSLAQYGLLLMDKGYTHDECKTEILRLNKQFHKPLAEIEITKTVFKTIERKQELEVEENEIDDEPFENEEDPFATVDY